MLFVIFKLYRVITGLLKYPKTRTFDCFSKGLSLLDFAKELEKIREPRFLFWRSPMPRLGKIRGTRSSIYPRDMHKNTPTSQQRTKWLQRLH